MTNNAKLSLLAALALWSCARNPVTGKKELMLVSEAQEIQMGRQASQQALRDSGVVADQLDQMALVNHLLLEDRVTAGTLLKTVTKPAVPIATQ